MSEYRVFPTVREAIHATATSGKVPMKELAPALDWSPSELSMRTTMGGDSARPFPLDDEHAVRIQQVTRDYSILKTMADKLGFDVRVKDVRVDEVIAEAKAEVQAAMRKFQMVLDLDDQRKGRGRGR